jgi:hypothetical protein
LSEIRKGPRNTKISNCKTLLSLTLENSLLRINLDSTSKWKLGYTSLRLLHITTTMNFGRNAPSVPCILDVIRRAFAECAVHAFEPIMLVHTSRSPTSY